MKALVSLVLLGAAAQAAPDLVIADFETPTLPGWTAEGNAFTRAAVRDRERARGAQGEGYLFSGQAGPQAQGSIVSPEFKIERKFLNFLITGQRDFASAIGVELLVEGRVVRSACATETFGPEFRPRTFAVEEFMGRTARLRVNDGSATGSVAVDSFTQSDVAATIPTDSTQLFAETYRPQFHFTAERGWLNDANGLLFYRGEWHLFHQHRPAESPATVWGHAVSPDLLHWRHLPTAIESEGGDAIFSGSAAVDPQNTTALQQGELPPVLLFYTQHPPANAGRKAVQCLAVSTDGMHTFRKFAGNPILATKDNNDRDPKGFFYAPAHAWYLLLSLSRNNIDREHATYGLFRSPDAKSGWEPVQEIGPGGWYWECPDFFEMRIDGDRKRTKWVLMKGSGDYLLGDFDGAKFTPESEPIRTSWGASFYGQQTFNDVPEGRRISIGWMNSGAKTEVPNHYPGMPFNQQMSFPREITLQTTPAGLRLFREPVREIAQLYTKTRELKDRPVEPGENALAGCEGELLDLELELRLGEAQEVTLLLHGEPLVYDAKAKTLKVGGRSLALAPLDGTLSLRLLLDRTSLELYANHGEVTHSTIFFPDPADHSLGLQVKGGRAQIERLAMHELRSIWAER